jgi:hypothetical protein
MENTKIYRADDYTNNMGDLIGFFSSKEEAESEIEFSNPANVGDGTFSQITEFEVEGSKLEGVELSDNEAVLSEKIWGSGIIINNYYYS